VIEAPEFAGCYPARLAVAAVFDAALSCLLLVTLM
jgi:hypothetical protein